MAVRPRGRHGDARRGVPGEPGARDRGAASRHRHRALPAGRRSHGVAAGECRAGADRRRADRASHRVVHRHHGASAGRGGAAPAQPRAARHQQLQRGPDAGHRRADPAGRHLPHRVRRGRVPDGVGGLRGAGRGEDRAAGGLGRRRGRLPRDRRDHQGRHRARRRPYRHRHPDRADRVLPGLRDGPAAGPVARRGAGARLPLEHRDAAPGRARGDLRSPVHLRLGARRLHARGDPVAGGAGGRPRVRDHGAARARRPGESRDPAPPVAEDGGRGPARGRHRPRLQQPADRDRRLRRAAAGRAAGERRGGPGRPRRDARRGGPGGAAHPPAARVRPPPGARARGPAPGRGGGPDRTHAPAGPGRAGRARHERGIRHRAGAGGPRAARAGDRQPRGQRPRRDARRRPPGDRDRGRRARPGATRRATPTSPAAPTSCSPCPTPGWA